MAIHTKSVKQSRRKRPTVLVHVRERFIVEFIYHILVSQKTRNKRCVDKQARSISSKGLKRYLKSHGLHERAVSVAEVLDRLNEIGVGVLGGFKVFGAQSWDDRPGVCTSVRFGDEAKARRYFTREHKRYRSFWAKTLGDKRERAERMAKAFGDWRGNPYGVSLKSIDKSGIGDHLTKPHQTTLYLGTLSRTERLKHVDLEIDIHASHLMSAAELCNEAARLKPRAAKTYLAAQELVKQHVAAGGDIYTTLAPGHDRALIKMLVIRCWHVTNWDAVMPGPGDIDGWDWIDAMRCLNDLKKGILKVLRRAVLTVADDIRIGANLRWDDRDATKGIAWRLLDRVETRAKSFAEEWLIKSGRDPKQSHRDNIFVDGAHLSDDDLKSLQEHVSAKMDMPYRFTQKFAA